MFASRPQTQSSATGAGTGPTSTSLGLEWLWQQLRDDRHPAFLDCGRMHASTMKVLLDRGSTKVYVADLLSPFRWGAPDLWDRTAKVPVFRSIELLRLLPEIPPESLSAIFCWQLFDLVPTPSLPELAERLFSYLRPGGVLFCLLREVHLPEGAETNWWLESPRTLGREGNGKMAFAYPPITNRQMEGLAPSGRVKTFLNRSGLREVVAMKWKF